MVAMEPTVVARDILMVILMVVNWQQCKFRELL